MLFILLVMGVFRRRQQSQWLACFPQSELRPYFPAGPNITLTRLCAAMMGMSEVHGLLMASVCFFSSVLRSDCEPKFELTLCSSTKLADIGEVLTRV